MGLAKNLRRLLAENNFSVAGFSRRTGIPAKTLYHWLAGQKPRNIDQIFIVCEALNVSVETLFGRGADRPPLFGDREFSQMLHVGSYEVYLRPLKKGEAK